MGQRSFEWQERFCREQRPEPCRIVIFGASGDLAKRKLFPSLAALDARGLLAPTSRITGCARHPYTTDSFRRHLADCFPAPLPADGDIFFRRTGYMPLGYDCPDDYRQLAGELQRQGDGTPVIFYLALPSHLYPVVVNRLAAAGLLTETPSGGPRRVVFEKPFGHDPASAAALDAALRQHLGEHQIYRIDHYLGKETVQNIFLLRFANRIFEPIWNASQVDSIQITVAEQLGVEQRAGYFDQAGLLRDMFQNHMLEMLSLVTMECPYTFSADAVRDEKIKLIRSIRPIAFTDTVRAQYDGYTSEPGVAPDSRTETYAALKLYIDNWRWQGVPVYLRAGKKLGIRRTELDIIFKPVPHSVFPGIPQTALQPDILHLHVQPEEGIGLTLQAKKAGPKLCMGALTLNYDYRESGGESLDAYARLLLDCQLGDQTLFIRSDVIAAAWQLYQPLLDHWAADTATPIPRYPQRSDGPPEAHQLLARDDREWTDDLAVPL
ncbi:MAG: glucose-6-phosphate dehydrogenase [Lentisphaeria bacterium]|nr:glucose-6-phosphate dehydrogenase [Lentisphaeria bacterium]